MECPRAQHAVRYNSGRRLLPRLGSILFMNLIARCGFVSIAVLLATVARAQPAHELCNACHTEVTDDFLTHPHSRQGLSCDACHGPSVRHRESAGGVEPDRVAGPLQVVALCGTCHDRPAKGEIDAAKSILKQYLASKHGAALANPSAARGPNCETCHSAHRARPPRAIRLRCEGCHEQLPPACSAEPPSGTAADLPCVGCHQPHLFAVIK